MLYSAHKAYDYLFKLLLYKYCPQGSLIDFINVPDLKNNKKQLS